MMKKNNLDFTTILYYVFIIVCITSAILSFFLQTHYLAITAVSSIGVAVIKIINK